MSVNYCNDARLVVKRGHMLHEIVIDRFAGKGLEH